MTDPREALVALIDAQGIADAIQAAGWTPPGERVKPTVEDVDFTEVANLAQEMLGKGVWPDTARAVFEAVLALLPGRTEAEVKAEALDEAAYAAVTDEEGIAWDDDYDRATVGAWLGERAEQARGEARNG